MSKPDKPQNPADRGPEALTGGMHGFSKGKQMEGNRRPDTDLVRGSEPATRGASSKP
jgi:hypothetical protein